MSRVERLAIVWAALVAGGALLRVITFFRGWADALTLTIACLICAVIIVSREEGP